MIYRPNTENDIGKIELRIADLANPLEGTFDLSQCGDASEYLSINTGYRKGMKPGKENKVEIWFAPHFLIANNLAESASHFKGTMGSWDPRTAPVGMFFNWGGSHLNKFESATKLKWDAYSANNKNNFLNIYHSQQGGRELLYDAKSVLSLSRSQYFFISF